MALQQYSSHPRLVICFPIVTHTSETGTLNMWPCNGISHIQDIVTYFPIVTHTSETGMLNMWPCNGISNIQDIVAYFPIVTHTRETGTAKGGRLLLATHLNQSNHLVNLQEVLGLAVPFASLSTLCKNAGPKPFC
jgi:hypothetical protein